MTIFYHEAYGRKLFFLFDEFPFEDVTDPVVPNLSETRDSRSKDSEQDTALRGAIFTWDTRK